MTSRYFQDSELLLDLTIVEGRNTIQRSSIRHFPNDPLFDERIVESCIVKVTHMPTMRTVCVTGRDEDVWTVKQRALDSLDQMLRPTMYQLKEVRE